MATTAQPFRFLDLPKDLRFMVYEHLPITTIKTLKLATTSGTRHVILTSTKYPAAFLASCRLIHEEALPFVNSAVKSNPPNITLSFDFPGLDAKEGAYCLAELLFVLKKTAHALRDHPQSTPARLRVKSHLLVALIVTNQMSQQSLCKSTDLIFFDRAYRPEILDLLVSVTFYARKMNHGPCIKLYWAGWHIRGMTLVEFLDQTVRDYMAEATVQLLDRPPALD